MQIDRHAAERLAPVGNRAIIMRMRNRNRLEAAERSDVFRRLVGEQGNAIPHHTAIALPAPAARAARSRNWARHRARECRDRHARPACDVSPAPRGSAMPGRSSSRTAARPRRPGTPPAVRPLSGNWAPHCSQVQNGKVLLPLSQPNIQPAERVDRHLITFPDDDRGGLGLDDRGACEGVAGLQRLQRIDRDLAPRRRKTPAASCAARRRSLTPQVLRPRRAVTLRRPPRRAH